MRFTHNEYPSRHALPNECDSEDTLGHSYLHRYTGECTYTLSLSIHGFKYVGCVYDSIICALSAPMIESYVHPTYLNTCIERERERVICEYRGMWRFAFEMYMCISTWAHLYL